MYNTLQKQRKEENDVTPVEAVMVLVSLVMVTLVLALIILLSNTAATPGVRETNSGRHAQLVSPAVSAYF